MTFDDLNEINSRPKPFQFYTAEELWTREHTSKKMLEYHLNDTIDLSSRNRAFIDRSVQWIVSHFDVIEGTRIADFGCGPGLYTTPLAERGALVTGIDFSARSIQYASGVAEQKGLAIDYVRQNYLEFVTERRFDLITMIFCDFCALSPEQRRTLLAKFRDLLADGGSVLLDVHSVNTFDKREEVATYERNQLDGFWSADEYFGFLNTFKYDQEKVMLDKFTIVEESGTRVVYNWLQYFTPGSIKAEFDQTGFDVAELFSDIAGAPFNPDSPDMAVVARAR